MYILHKLTSCFCKLCACVCACEILFTGNGITKLIDELKIYSYKHIQSNKTIIQTPDIFLYIFYCSGYKTL